MAAFEELGVQPEISKAVEEMDWLLPTDVQAEAIPLILGGGDVLMAAETGSGKTGAFCLPIIQIVWETLKDIQSGKAGKGHAPHHAGSSKWAMSFFDRNPAMAITPEGLRCQSREQKEWHGCRATRGVHSKGKWYFEAIAEDEGLCRVGWSTSKASLDLGTCPSGFGFGGTGKKSNNRQFDSYGEAFGLNDVMGCLLNLDDMTIAFCKNGHQFGTAFHIPKSMKDETFYPAVVLKNAQMVFNLSGPFKCEPPAGYKGVTEAPADLVTNNQASSGETKKGTAPAKNAPQAIIIEPSRELAEQTFNQIKLFKKYLDNPTPRDLLVIGGVSVKEQIADLQAGVDLVVGTPGRLEDLINGGQLSLTQVRFFVLDEADGLIKQGHEQLINKLHGQIPKLTSDGRRLQMVVCSATLHDFQVKKMAERMMHFPTWIDLKGQDSVPETVHHVVVHVDPNKDHRWSDMRQHVQTDGVHARDDVRPGKTNPETLSEAVKLLKGEYVVRAIKEHKMDRALVFCRTKLDCDNLERYFTKLGGGPRNPGSPFSCVCLHGDRKPPERKQNLEKFKQQQIKFLICTDVAARGIDVAGLPFLINVTLPDDKANYVHRIGRVGRAERMGLAISIVSDVPEKVWYHGEWCSSRGRNCFNTRLTSEGGCCIWYNEMQFLADIEEHLGVTIPEVGLDMRVPVDDFEGKVTYGQKRKQMGSNYQTHVAQLAPAVKDLAAFESQAQIIYLKRQHLKENPWDRL
ncbi:unnamed protein product [Cyprideis torosa]|uniref:ATP-dependent RNA helicase n=1 Tax=Cyprideis torosa TaxID=163714 RepID=A0A7R8W7L5_9CRUS|nr:unnamed protein product [Cyprideis torosa]CAG0887653.1 unnamed protein product [Cyprideis torosa]